MKTDVLTVLLAQITSKSKNVFLFVQYVLHNLLFNQSNPMSRRHFPEMEKLHLGHAVWNSSHSHISDLIYGLTFCFGFGFLCVCVCVTFLFLAFKPLLSRVQRLDFPKNRELLGATLMERWWLGWNCKDNTSLLLHSLSVYGFQM